LVRFSQISSHSSISLCKLAKLAAISAISNWQSLFLADGSAEFAAILVMGLPPPRLPNAIRFYHKEKGRIIQVHFRTKGLLSQVWVWFESGLARI